MPNTPNTNTPNTNTPAETVWIDLNLIDIPADARQHDPEKLATLAADMGKQKQLQEIVVTTVGERYEVLAGVGRTLAARKLGWERIRASVREGVSEFDKARITFAENEDREDADPFYQASQVTKMMKAKECTQLALAKELGISDSLVSFYAGIDALSEPVKQNSKRLEFGQLIQICRLKNDQEQIDLAKKTLSDDLSVRQLKTIVDSLLTSKKKAPNGKPTAAKGVDPLTAVWPLVKTNAGLKGMNWKASYQGDCRWSLSVTVPKQAPGPDMARWLGLMQAAFLEALANTDGRDNLDSLIPKTRTDLERMMPDPRRLSLPDGRGAEDRLRDAAVLLGPEEVFKHIFGHDSLAYRKVLGKTWQDLGCADPTAALQKMLDGLRKIRLE